MSLVIEIKELVYRRRKGFCLRIDENGDLIVFAPYFATEEDIKKVVMKKANWILRTRELVLRNNQKAKPINFVANESLLFLGDFYKIDFHSNSNIVLDEEEKKIFFPNADKYTLKRKLLNFYYEKAREILKNKLDKWSDVMGLQYKVFRLKNAQRLWGSCGKNSSINLNWRLVLLPEDIIDHIIIHELSHLVYRNHSKQFKNLVSKYSPNYREKEKWLRENSYILQMFRET